MIKFIGLVLVAALFYAMPVEARTRGSTTGQYVHVNGYVRANGRYVQSYWRAAPGTAIGRHYGSYGAPSYGPTSSRQLSALAPSSFAPSTDGGLNPGGAESLVTALSYPPEGYAPPDVSKPVVINEASLAWCPVGKIVGTGYGVCEIN